MQSIWREQIKELSSALRQSGQLPGLAEISRIGDAYLSTLSDPRLAPNLIQEDVFCGMASDPLLSTLKCLVEYIERMAFKEGHQRGDRACMTKRSDGFAAFPIVKGDRKSALKAAHSNALCEAVERFSWATWWD